MRLCRSVASGLLHLSLRGPSRIFSWRGVLGILRGCLRLGCFLGLLRRRSRLWRSFWLWRRYYLSRSDSIDGIPHVPRSCNRTGFAELPNACSPQAGGEVACARILPLANGTGVRWRSDPLHVTPVRASSVFCRLLRIRCASHCAPKRTCCVPRSIDNMVGPSSTHCHVYRLQPVGGKPACLVQSCGAFAASP